MFAFFPRSNLRFHIVLIIYNSQQDKRLRIAARHESFAFCALSEQYNIIHRNRCLCSIGIYSDLEFLNGPLQKFMKSAIQHRLHRLHYSDTQVRTHWCTLHYLYCIIFHYFFNEFKAICFNNFKSRKEKICNKDNWECINACLRTECPNNAIYEGVLNGAFQMELL